MRNALKGEDMAIYDLEKAIELKDKLGKLMLEMTVKSEKLSEIRKPYELAVMSIAELVADGYEKHKVELETLREEYVRMKAEMLNLDDELFALKTEYKATKDQFMKVRFHILFDEPKGVKR